MEFNEILNSYIEKVGCTNKGLSDLSGISAETIGRYRKGSRKPTRKSDTIQKLSEGLSKLSDNKLSEAEIYHTLYESLNDGINVEFNIYVSNLNKLTECMEISKSELAKGLNFDPSYISRILSGKRKPSQIQKFNSDISMFASRRLFAFGKIPELAELIGCNADTLKNEETAAKKIYKWLGANDPIMPTYHMDKFLLKLDEFDLDEYIKAIRFDKIKLPASPFRFPSTKKGSGLAAMMELEMDFIKATILSKSKDDIIIYSDMPMEEMAKDKEFPKKWMFGTAMMLKKGLHLHMIHDISRPFEEMMLGLESYIPMYMTGQISPYYLKNNQSEIFHHMIKVSGAASLSGEAISSCHKDGRYYFTNNKEELKYYRKRASDLLSKAYPLMDIYTESNQIPFNNFFKKFLSLPVERKMIFGSLPSFTLTDDLLCQIAKRQNLKKSEIDRLKNFIRTYKKLICKMLEDNKAEFEIPVLTEEEFIKAPLNISFPENFFYQVLPCTYNEYLLHLKETKKFASEYSNCTLTYGNTSGFRNITITIISNTMVMVSKNISPAIHFVIHHPRMVEAFENFAFPILDDQIT